jgi:hypothetical protein
MAKRKSSLMAYFINTGTVAVPVWSPLGKGVTSMPVSMNPQITRETYIDEDNASASLDSYQTSWALDVTLWDATTAPAHEYLNTKRKIRATGADAETEILEVDISGESPYPATRSAAVLGIDTFTLEGGKAQRLGCTAYESGDPVQGTCVIAAGVPTFTAA